MFLAVFPTLFRGALGCLDDLVKMRVNGGAETSYCPAGGICGFLDSGRLGSAKLDATQQKKTC